MGSTPLSLTIKQQQEGLIRLDPDAESVSLRVLAGGRGVICGSPIRLDIVLEEGASLEVVRVPAEGRTANDGSVLNVHQVRDSILRSFYFTSGGVSLKDRVNVILAGSGAQAYVNGLHCLAGSTIAESHTYIEHAASATISNQLYKAIVRDRGHSSFNGRIMVRREAQLTNAYQLNKNLVLSPEAKADTRPQLEIFADDVKCSHGATIGQLDEDQLFYFETRGITASQAREMLIKGFIEDVLAQIHQADLRAEVAAMVR